MTYLTDSQIIISSNWIRLLSILLKLLLINTWLFKFFYLRMKGLINHKQWINKIFSIFILKLTVYGLTKLWRMFMGIRCQTQF